MAKKASVELAEYQRKHGTAYESGLPGPNNAMLAASEEVLRQIAHVIRPYSHPDSAARDRSSSDARRENRRTSPAIERNRQSEPLMSSPFGPNDVTADSVEYLPQRRQNRGSFNTAGRASGLRSNDHRLTTVFDGSPRPAANTPEIQLSPDKPPSIASDRASHVSKLDTGGTSSRKGVSPKSKRNFPI